MVRYDVSCEQANLRYIQFKALIPVTEAELVLELASWRPGRYELGNFAKNNKAGMIKKPPPAPKKPVTIPIKKPIIPSCIKFVFPVVVLTSFFLIIDTEAAIISKEKIIIIRKLFETW